MGDIVCRCCQGSDQLQYLYRFDGNNGFIAYAAVCKKCSPPVQEKPRAKREADYDNRR
jgi:hypothetical protein